MCFRYQHHQKCTECGFTVVVRDNPPAPCQWVVQNYSHNPRGYIGRCGQIWLDIEETYCICEDCWEYFRRRNQEESPEPERGRRRTR